MKLRLTHIARLICASALTWGAPPLLLAEKTPVKLQAPQKPSQEREDYQECIAAVIKKYKNIPPLQRNARVRYGIETCRERYPAVSIVVECKREMTAAYKDNANDLKAALRQCREEYAKFKFNPKVAVPFVMKEDLAFFAGAGLNRSLVVRAKEAETEGQGIYLGENFGNYSCSPLLASMFQNQKPEYLLFGNDLFLYTPLRHANKEGFLKSLGLTVAKTPSSTVHREWGELTYEPKTAEAINYFPTAACYFDRKLGGLYAGIKIYYLLDRNGSQVTPYFGSAFYNETSEIQSQQLANSIKETLGLSYQVHQIKEGVFFISQTKPTAFDSEGDPKNICQTGQTSPYMAIVRSREKSTLAAYSLLANTANLCRFGDRLSSRFLKKGGDPPTPPKASP